MKSMNRKDVAEIIGLVAIVSSLIFVGIQLRQAQSIAMADGYSMLFATRVEVANSIKEHTDIWRRGAAGEELDDNETTIFALLVNQVNETGVQGFLHAWQVAGVYEADFNARQFAAFLYQNPGARTVWNRREDSLTLYRSLLSEEGDGDEIWTDAVRHYLAELDRHQPPVDDEIHVDW